MRLSTIERKRFRVRKKLKNVSTDRYRLSVSRSTKNISAQIIDDVKNITLVSASSLDKEIKGQKKKQIRIIHYCCWNTGQKSKWKKYQENLFWQRNL